MVHTLEDSVDRYLDDLMVGASDQTVDTYRYALKLLREFLCVQHISPYRDVRDYFTVDFVVGFAQWVRERPISKSTFVHYLTPVSQLYTFLVREQNVNASAAELMRLRAILHQYRKGIHRPLPVVSQTALDEVIKAARRVKPDKTNRRNELMRLRDIAMFEALRSSGMRVGELVRLRRGDFDHYEHTAVVKGKGDRERVVFFYPRAWKALTKYWQARGDSKHAKKRIPSLPAFARHNRKVGRYILPMTPDGIAVALKSLVQQAGITKRVTCHSFRHGFATKVLNATGDLAVVQDLLGHQQIETTRIYARVATRRMRLEHSRAFAPPEREPAMDLEMLQVIDVEEKDADLFK